MRHGGPLGTGEGHQPKPGGHQGLLATLFLINTNRLGVFDVIVSATATPQEESRVSCSELATTVVGRYHGVRRGCSRRPRKRREARWVFGRNYPLVSSR